MANTKTYTNLSAQVRLIQTSSSVIFCRHLGSRPSITIKRPLEASSELFDKKNNHQNDHQRMILNQLPSHFCAIVHHIKALPRTKNRCSKVAGQGATIRTSHGQRLELNIRIRQKHLFCCRTPHLSLDDWCIIKIYCWQLSPFIPIYPHLLLVTLW